MVRLTDRPDMTLDVYRGRKTTIQHTTEQFEEYFQALSDPNDSFYTADEDILYCNQQYERGEFQIIFDELNKPITIEEVRTAIKQ